MRLGRGSGISLRRGRGVFFHRLPLSLRPAGQERLVVVASACRHGQSSSRAMAPGGALRGRSTGGRRLNDSSSAFFAFLRFRFTQTSSPWWPFTKSATSALPSGGDRKSVVLVKSGSVRVSLGGRRIIQKI